MKLRLSLYILALFTFVNVSAQDIHLSQTNMTPLLVNPANAGAEYTMRGIVNYRNQWASVSEPYTTMMASFDANFKPKGRDKKPGYFAGGLYMFNDKAGASEMKTTQINLSIAYHLNLDDKNTLGLGIQGGYFQRSANTDNLTWGNQYDGFAYDAGISTGEGQDFTGFSFGTTDFNSGLVWTFRNNEKYLSGKNLLITSGISMHHLTKPNVETKNLTPDLLHYRFIWHGSAIVGVNEKFSVLPYLFFSQQGSIHEIMFGSNVLYKFKQASKYTTNIKGMAIGGGVFYRWNDAVIADIIFQYANYTIEFSYDINTSSLNNATGRQGAFELSLRYVYPNPFGGVKNNARFN
jgi:type IX secretion system PorP/SprF family membrane protein